VSCSGLELFVVLTLILLMDVVVLAGLLAELGVL